MRIEFMYQFRHVLNFLYLDIIIDLQKVAKIVHSVLCMVPPAFPNGSVLYSWSRLSNWEINRGTTLLTRLQGFIFHHFYMHSFVCVYVYVVLLNFIQRNHPYNRDVKLSHHHRVTPLCCPFIFACLGNDWSALYLYSFIMLRIFCKWKHTVCNFLRVIFFH